MAKNKHECLHNEELKNMQSQISNVDKNVAVIVTKMEDRDKQRAIDRKMYQEGLEKMQNEISANTKFRTEAKGVIGFIIITSGLVGSAVIWLANKFWGR